MKRVSLHPARFQILLVVLLGFYAILPFFESTLLVDIMGTAVLIFAISAVSESRRTLVAGCVIAALAAGANWGGRWVPGEPILVVAILLDLSFYLLVCRGILTYVFRSRDITRETLAAAICACLLIAAVWADLYSVIETVAPGSFSGSGLDHSVMSAKNLAAHLSYFSFVTLSTLGYGDITPITRPARNLAALEAIAGQLYLAVLVARIVSQLAPNIRREVETGKAPK